LIDVRKEKKARDAIVSDACETVNTDSHRQSGSHGGLCFMLLQKRKIS